MTVEQQMLALVCYVSVALIRKIAKRTRISTFDGGHWRALRDLAITLLSHLKMGYFYWLCVENSNNLHTGLSLDYLKDTKFYHESKASFTRISSIASFKPFLTVWLREYCTFSDSSVVSSKFSPWPKYTQYGTILQKKSCSTIKLFSFFKYVLY